MLDRAILLQASFYRVEAALSHGVLAEIDQLDARRRSQLLEKLDRTCVSDLAVREADLFDTVAEENHLGDTLSSLRLDGRVGHFH